MGNSKGNGYTPRQLIEERAELRLDEGLKYIDGQIGKLYNGTFGILVNPIAKTLNSYVIAPGIKARALSKLGVVLECAEDGNGENGSFEEYLEYDELWRRRNPQHKDIRKAANIIRKMFGIHIELAEILLDARGDTYNALALDAFPNRKNLEKYLLKQYRLNKQVIAMVKENGIVKIPALIKTEAVFLLKKGQAYLEKVEERDLNEIYRSMA